jgi:hypothetical protein
MASTKRLTNASRCLPHQPKFPNRSAKLDDSEALKSLRGDEQIGASVGLWIVCPMLEIQLGASRRRSRQLLRMDDGRFLMETQADQ